MVQIQHVDVPVRAYCTLIGYTTKWLLTRHVSYICKMFDETFLPTLRPKQHTSYTFCKKKHEEDILTLLHELRSLDFPYLLVVASLIKLAFLTVGNALWVTLYLSL